MAVTDGTIQNEETYKKLTTLGIDFLPYSSPITSTSPVTA